MKVVQFRQLDAGASRFGDAGEKLVVGAANRTVKIERSPGGSPDRNFDRLVYPGGCDPSAPGGVLWNPALGRTGPESLAMSVVGLAGARLFAARPANFRRDDARRSHAASGATGR
jgi:hypothetical protein